MGIILDASVIVVGEREIFNLGKIDRWFLTQLKEIVDLEEELANLKN